MIVVYFIVGGAIDDANHRANRAEERNGRDRMTEILERSGRESFREKEEKERNEAIRKNEAMKKKAEDDFQAIRLKNATI